MPEDSNKNKLEECDDCPTPHISLEEAVNTLKRRHRFMVIGYFLSLIGGAASLSVIFGPAGGLGAVCAFGVYFFHLNMRVSSSNLELLENAATAALRDVRSLPEGTKTKPTHVAGQYI